MIQKGGIHLEHGFSGGSVVEISAGLPSFEMSKRFCIMSPRKSPARFLTLNDRERLQLNIMLNIENKGYTRCCLFA